ncbi:hypothetical protein [Shewanella sp. YLB-07]|uniref:hypothetical protein n=1 Tax=Shewanella sp. YLB-07 TaxID=2601268 RepID=UPI00128B8CCC|nr:hypothetical protein [Shewanella sp. YLB-07]MPY26711.1 hypothetical protein [Shewanella sp. YLB-07]
MTSNVESIINQFMQLSQAEQQQLMHMIRTKRGDSLDGVKHRGGDFFGDRIGSSTINFAPTPGSCPRCGK